jgi:hypothetical protein
MPTVKARKVQNINGTSDKSCPCGSWIDHWEKFSGESLPNLCPEKTCTKKDLVGAHVQRADSTDKGWYIVPLCSEHNKQATTLELWQDTTLVSANVAQTCG